MRYVHCFFAVFFIFKYAYRKNVSIATLAGMNASVSNSYLIALPILIAIFGIKATVPVTVTAIIVMLFYVPVITFLLEYGRVDRQQDEALFFKAIKRTFTNPMVIAAILGVLFAAFKLGVPQPVFQWLHYIGATAVGLALITVGVELGNIKLSGKLKPIVFLTIVDLLVKPTLAFAVARALNMPPL